MNPDMQELVDINYGTWGEEMDPDEHLLLFLLLNDMLLKVALQISADDFDPDMCLYYREADVSAKILALLPDQYQGAVIMDVQKIDGVVTKRVSVQSI